MKEDAYTKGLAKNQVSTIFYMREIWENVFIRLCPETACWCAFEGHKYGSGRPAEKSVFEFSYANV